MLPFILPSDTQPEYSASPSNFSWMPFHHLSIARHQDWAALFTIKTIPFAKSLQHHCWQKHRLFLLTILLCFSTTSCHARHIWHDCDSLLALFPKYSHQCDSSPKCDNTPRFHPFQILPSNPFSVVGWKLNAYSKSHFPFRWVFWAHRRNTVEAFLAPTFAPLLMGWMK